MTKADIVSEISEKTGLEKSEVMTTVEAFMLNLSKNQSLAAIPPLPLRYLLRYYQLLPNFIISLSLFLVEGN